MQRAADDDSDEAILREIQRQLDAQAERTAPDIRERWTRAATRLPVRGERDLDSEVAQHLWDDIRKLVDAHQDDLGYWPVREAIHLVLEHHGAEHHGAATFGFWVWLADHKLVGGANDGA